ncbi:MAG: aldo/keto reductase [Bacillota bacterium]|nr:aldo/keto reductase [Bacillota bacterium]
MLPAARLGDTGIEVTRLGFGALPIGPVQADVPVAEAAQVIRRALERGVTFIDTAHTYKTYEHIRRAKEGWTGPLVIATKTPASSYDEAEEHIRYALSELDVDRLDIVLLHSHRLDERVFEDRAGAHTCLRTYKARGLVRAIGISTHRVSVARAAAERDDIDVIHPLINMAGLGLLGGTVDEMAEAIRIAAGRGKGIYVMKALGGGHLISRREEAFRYVLGLPGVHAVAVGMVSPAEVDMNCRIFSGETIPASEQEATFKRKRLKIIPQYCKGCGSCVEACPSGALSLVDGKSRVDASVCILCGYCSPACPEFAIRVI